MSGEEVVSVDAGGTMLEAGIAIPERCPGVVVFAHGSGSSRHSPRNRQVAARLRQEGLGTLLLDLLTAEEDQVDRVTREHRFDIDLLAGRLAGAMTWLGARRETASLPVGLFGASTGAAAALVAASGRADRVGAVVSRGGRPDLAGPRLADVAAPTLLIVGGADMQVLDLNRRAQRQMRCDVTLEVVPGASHLFEEPGALETVGDLAARWFARHLGRSAGLPRG